MWVGVPIGAEETQVDAVLRAVALAVALGNRGEIGVAHARLERAERRPHGAVLHARRAPHQLLLLRALDHLDLVHQVARVHELGIGQAAVAQVVDQPDRHLVGADQPDRAAGVGAERLLGELRIVFRRVVAGRVARRRHPGLHAAAHAVALVRQLLLHAERALVDHRHVGVAREHDRHRIAVGGRQVGEVFDVAAHVVVVVLHQQDVDLLRLHGLAHRLPAAFQLGGRDRVLQAFGQLHVGLLQRRSFPVTSLRLDVVRAVEPINQRRCSASALPH